MLFALAYHSCINLYYRNRPRPLPKKMKKYMKKDCVLDENNQTVSLAEYNYRHATEYTLDDVYGKGYVESLTDAENGGYPPTQNGDIRSLFWLFSLMALQN